MSEENIYVMVCGREEKEKKKKVRRNSNDNVRFTEERKPEKHQDPKHVKTN